MRVEDPEAVMRTRDSVAVRPEELVSVRETVPGKPFWPVTVMVKVPGVPASSVREPGLEEMVKSTTWTVIRPVVWTRGPLVPVTVRV